MYDEKSSTVEKSNNGRWFNNKTVVIVAIALSIILSSSIILHAFIVRPKTTIIYDNNTHMQARQSTYNELKEITKNEISNSPTNDRPRTWQKAIEKYDEKFFNAYYNMLETNEDPTVIAEFLLSMFDVAENEIWDSIAEKINNENTLEDPFGYYIKGTIKLVIKFMLSTAMYYGWAAGKIFGLAAKLAIFGSSAGIIGTIVGAALGLIMATAVQAMLKPFFEKYNANFETTWFEKTIFSISKWYIFINIPIVINIASVLLTLLTL